jgi:DNA processing protein
VWQALGPDGAGFDELLQRAGLTTATLAPILLAMELDGRLTKQHGVYIPRGSAPHTRAGLQRRR